MAQAKQATNRRHRRNRLWTKKHTAQKGIIRIRQRKVREGGGVRHRREADGDGCREASCVGEKCRRHTHLYTLRHMASPVPALTHIDAIDGPINAPLASCTFVGPHRCPYAETLLNAAAAAPTPRLSARSALLPRFPLEVVPQGSPPPSYGALAHS